MWFEELCGFDEDAVIDVAAQFAVDGGSLMSLVNSRPMQAGRFETPTLHELRDRCASMGRASGGSTVREVVADVQQLHLDVAVAGALFQVASQFNTLEMASPEISPEDGIAGYEFDRTQGPACAVACGAGTIFRNYLVEVDGRSGQSSDRQINCLASLADALEVEIGMSNGYAFPTGEQLSAIETRIGVASEAERSELMGTLRIGMQWDTEVTLNGGGHLVTQAYCSALPIAYSSVAVESWSGFARLVLDAAYEATLAAAVVNAEVTGNNRVFLTLLGGGVFGNPLTWILDAVERALDLFADARLDVAIVSHGQPNKEIQTLLGER